MLKNLLDNICTVNKPVLGNCYRVKTIKDGFHITMYVCSSMINNIKIILNMNY